MKLKCVTITGADESVHHGDMLALSLKYPFLEWGILLSASRAGREPRYPALKWVEALFRRYHEFNPDKLTTASQRNRLALHICGQWFRALTELPPDYKTKLPYGFWPLWTAANRVQLNGLIYSDFVSSLEQLVSAPGSPQIVVQWSSKDNGYGNRNVKGVLPLYDESGGKGLSPTEWLSPPLEVKYAGYAGGLNPDNLADNLQAIAGLMDDGEFWVDMESGVRSEVNGRSVFDLEKVEACLQIAERHMAKQHVTTA